jgi:Fic family protein
MDLYAWAKTEQDPVYQQVETANNLRYTGFLRSMIDSAISSSQSWLSEPFIKAINFHAIVALHPEAGQYRSVDVKVDDYTPPPFCLVPSLMEEFVENVNQNWDVHNTMTLAAYALWGVNAVHPFVNGNGRTARAACYFIVCVKAGGVLPGNPTLPEMLREEPIRSEYVKALKTADSGGVLNDLGDLINKLITQQLQ